MLSHEFQWSSTDDTAVVQHLDTVESLERGLRSAIAEALKAGNHSRG